MTVPNFVKAGGAMVALAGVAMAGLALFGPAADGVAARNIADAPRAPAGGAALSTAPSAAPAPAPLTRSNAPMAAPQPAPTVTEARRKLDEALRAGQPAGQQVAALAAPVAPPAGEATRAAPLVRSLAQPAPALASAPAAAAIADAGADVNDLCDRAKRELQDGSVAGARALLGRAARGGAPRALFMLGETFDPAALAEQGLDAKADAARARAYYEKAAAGGHSDAARRLAALTR